MSDGEAVLDKETAARLKREADAKALLDARLAAQEKAFDVAAARERLAKCPPGEPRDRIMTNLDHGCYERAVDIDLDITRLEQVEAERLEHAAMVAKHSAVSSEPQK